VLKQFYKLKKFLGPKVTRLGVICVFIGVFSFIVETSFVFILQLFLINLGLLDKASSFLPDWLPPTPMFGFITLILFGFAKALAYGGRIFFSVKTQQAFIFRQRTNLLKTGLLQGGRLSTKELSSAFSELTTQAGLVALDSCTIIVALVSAILFAIYGLTLAPKEMLIGVFMLFLLGLPLKHISRRINNTGKELIKNFTSVNEALLLGLKNNFLIKIYGLADIENEKGVKHLEKYEKNYLSYGLSDALTSSFPLISGIFIISVLTLVGSQYFNTSGIKLMTFFYVFIRFAQAISNTIRIGSKVRLNFESFKKLYHWSIIEDKTIPTNFSSKSIQLNKNLVIKAKNLAFKYDENFIFKNINFELSTKDILLIKGGSGSGKSTLLNVITGLYLPTEGSISFNDLNNVPNNISEFIGYVGPNPYIIPGTIKENLIYGLQGTKTDDEYWQALSSAKIEDVIKVMPNQLDEKLSDTAELSTGQQQRLSIARAILRQPKLLILDEATSNLDHNTEDSIVQSLKALSSDMTVIVVSHREAFDSIATHNLDMTK
jgi:ATP-binding cassette subfamily B protein AbcA/BmrA